MKKSILCPNCNGFLTKADEDERQIIKIACRKCNKWIWVNLKTKRCEVKRIPERTTSSGKAFY